MDATAFRTMFPEFGDKPTYPDGSISFYLGLAVGFVNADAWGDNTDYGIGLFTAHHLSISARDQLAAEAGGVGGQVNGILSAKTVDKVSSSYDTASVSLVDAGFWNMTSYGIKFLMFARLLGAGGIQL